jgi:alpha-mannosidase
MQKHIEITRQRLVRFGAELTNLFYPQRAPIALSVYAAPGRISFDEAMRGEYRPARVGKKFGPLWATHWFRVDITIPEAWRGQPVHLLWDSASEACVWQNGAPLQGLTGSFGGYSPDEAIRKEFALTKNARGGETIVLYIEMAANGMFGLDAKAYNERIGELRQAEIAVFDVDAWNLYWDYKIIADMALQLASNTPRAGQALHTANRMVNAIRLDDVSTWGTAREIAAQFFAAHNGGGQHNLSAIGHAHIDTAWLWTIAETKRKCVRSFATAVRYMDEYPEYKFVCSQAQQYAWVQESAPSLYARIKQKVDEGQFIPAGGTWIEPDCNIPSGESLVRQFLFGQRFFEQAFGARCREFWNPDVFGYSGALPQIMQQAGMKYFLTQKLAWNQFNRPANHTFLWEGIDGSRVLTHFPPANNYNATATVKEVLFDVSNFNDHERANESYMLFGYGDGGGGPTPAMLEQIRRMRDVDGLPRVQIRTPQEFFARADADLQDPAVWVGELYFELHRGTYTTQARNKKFNRQSEQLLRSVEMLASLAAFTRGATYPTSDLQELWKLVLLNQFHDILPGSSIAEVYQESAQQYEHVLRRGDELQTDALNQLVPASKHGDKIAVFNTLNFPRTEVVALPEGIAGQQISADGRALGMVSAPALGFAIQTPQDFSETTSAMEWADGFGLENARLRATFNRQGGLTSLFDKTAQRECIERGRAGNAFVLYEDKPNRWDAWDVDVFHLEKTIPTVGTTSAKRIESGPLRAAIQFEITLSATSSIRQTVSLATNSARLDFACHAEWHEKQKFLKVAFPLNLRASHATYEIQFGHVQRTTHFNTTYDIARFESPAQKWADLSEPDFGVALLNDCKYGYAAHGNVLRLSLLRAPKHPDPNADQGEHDFRYALFPHIGGPQLGGVIEEASRFNVPLLGQTTDAPMGQQSFFSADQPALVIDTIKKAEDSDALIVRLYEARGTRGAARLSSPLPFRTAARVNILEDEVAVLDWRDGSVELNYRPFELITIRLE